MTSEYKLSLTPQTIETAAPRVRKILESAKSEIGFVPNLYALIANAPVLLESYLYASARFREGAHFSPAEQEVILLTVSRDNACHYCVAAHSCMADSVSKVPREITDAIRAAKPLPDPRLRALSEFVTVMVDTRGFPRRVDVENFLQAGYTEQNILEVVLAIAIKTMSNYANHLLHTPVDEAFRGRLWESSGVQRQGK